MDIVVNLSAIEAFISLPPQEIFWVFFANFGWMIIAIIFLYGMRDVYLLYIRTKWAEDHKNILLAIDIPRGNEQSPKAVENLFTYIAGAHGSISFFEKWFEGKFQKSFSFEIVSLEGYTQFLVHAPTEFRNLVESAVYSQYPDAEISEVDDYVKGVPSSLPDDEYDVWGTEFVQVKSDVYPIKLYQEFEHNIGPSETQFKDPMASYMDLCGSLRQGEHLWFQMIVIPTGFDWVKRAEAEIDKIFGRKKKTSSFINTLVDWMGQASELVYSLWSDIDDKKKEDKPRTMMDLTPLEKRKVENLQIKLSKIGFEIKLRFVYVARRDAMNKAKVANGIVGFMKQFAALDLNNLKPDIDYTFTKAQYFFTERRLEQKKRNIYSAYRNRSDFRGRLAGIFNVEEMATIWHFPIEANVKAAMVQKAPGRKADAPASLPLAEEAAEELPDIFRSSSGGGFSPEGRSAEASAREDLGGREAVPPPNLPFV